MAVIPPDQKRFDVIRLYQAGVPPERIAAQLQLSQEYVRESIRGQNLQKDTQPSEYLEFLLSKTNLALSQHTQATRALISECLHLEQELTLLDVQIRHCAEREKIKYLPRRWGAGKFPVGQPAAKDEQLRNYYAAIEPLMKRRQHLRHELIECNKAINANNASLVDTMVRMGVPAIAARMKIESPPESSIPEQIGVDLIVGDGEGLRRQIEESVDRQRKWLKRGLVADGEEKGDLGGVGGETGAET